MTETNSSENRRDGYVLASVLRSGTSPSIGALVKGRWALTRGDNRWHLIDARLVDCRRWEDLAHVPDRLFDWREALLGQLDDERNLSLVLELSDAPSMRALLRNRSISGRTIKVGGSVTDWVHNRVTEGELVSWMAGLMAGRNVLRIADDYPTGGATVPRAEILDALFSYTVGEEVDQGPHVQTSPIRTIVLAVALAAVCADRTAPHIPRPPVMLVRGRHQQKLRRISI